jgi:hypothetical protein
MKMDTEDCSWNAIDVLNVVDGAELVTVVRDIYLCVWYGGRTIEIYDITDPAMKSEMESLLPHEPNQLLYVHDRIDNYFDLLDQENFAKDLTTEQIRAIVETE